MVSKLFVVDGKGLEFNVSRQCPDYALLVKKIRENGGVVSRKCNDQVLILLWENSEAHFRNLKEHLFFCKTSFVHDSIANQTVQDPKKYRVRYSDLIAKKSPTGRLAYTPEDDIRMFKFIEKKKSNYNPNSVKIWKIAEVRKVTRHSAESMRNHWRKHLNNSSSKIPEIMEADTEEEEQSKKGEEEEEENEEEEEEEGEEEEEEEGEGEEEEEEGEEEGEGEGGEGEGRGRGEMEEEEEVGLEEERALFFAGEVAIAPFLFRVVSATPLSFALFP